MLRRTLGEDVELRLELGSGIGSVRADAGQLEQMLLNLALNARDAMPSGGSIMVETWDATLDAGSGPGTTRVEPGRYAGIRVRDTGHGMDDATLTHIFEPFFTTKGVGRGTGLGLASVYGIIKQHGGYVYVQSALGQGTTSTSICRPPTPRRRHGPGLCRVARWARARSCWWWRTTSWSGRCWCGR